MGVVGVVVGVVVVGAEPLIRREVIRLDKLGLGNIGERINIKEYKPSCEKEDKIMK